MSPYKKAVMACVGLLFLSSTVELEGRNGNRLKLASDDEIGATAYDRRILDLERTAIEAAFNEQIVHLYQTWMKDDTGQPDRAGKGAQQARRAYIRSMAAIDQRVQKLDIIGNMNKK